MGRAYTHVLRYIDERLGEAAQRLMTLPRKSIMNRQQARHPLATV